VSVILLRHAWAGHRGEWSEDDLLRPLDERGHRQARELPRLELYGLEVGRIVSSPYVRCVETVTPLAATRLLPIELDRRLSEGAERSAVPLLAELDGGVACTHGDVIEAILGRGLKKGAAAVVEVADGEVHVLSLLSAP
jgi:8-oxo-dGTP diphosphatase